jgi:hypothetical protein
MEDYKVEVKHEEPKAQEPAKPTRRIKKPSLPRPNKKLLMIIAGAIVLIVAALCVYKFVLFPNNAANITEQIGRSYYTDFFYGQASTMSDEKKTEFLKKSESTGLSVSLDNLLRFVKHNKSEDEYKKFESATKSCDVNASKVVITPKEPYGATNFTITTKMECEK